MANCKIVASMLKYYLVRNSYRKRGRKFVRSQGVAPIQLFPHVKKILNEQFMLSPDGRSPKYRTAVFSAPKKSTKTETGGAVLYSYAREYGGLCLAIANDKDQASRSFERVSRMLNLMRREDPERYKSEIDSVKNDEIVFKEFHDQPNGRGIIRAIPCDPSGEAGHENLALTHWDELWAYGDREKSARMWSELQPVPNIPYSMRLVTTYACTGPFGGRNQWVTMGRAWFSGVSMMRQLRRIQRRRSRWGYIRRG